ncbi:Flap endonuclease GEN-like protein [Lachnellula hyalina]|uniref:Flap endonuclease GEN-like protein n=1 Tax=Lachnellula hyalina TaxID=1316788 RepID=A0A8H8QUD6_9HELO|nr:Flap endonuclease GEN-like protein [Lachnellula hyalina]TVY22919.1 Flap endonuclease GEN-like protein [Lachnellula hyalina]
MGIGYIWDILEEYEEIKNIADFAAESLANEKRPLRIAVDEPYWRYKNVQPEEAEEIKRKYPGANPIEKNTLYVLLNVLLRGVQLVFVFDGPGRPEKKGRQPFDAESERTLLLRELLDQLGVVCWDAPGEAEAECARMQMLGLVDAVWTEEADAFMFGGDVVIKFHYDAQRRKSKDCFKVYDLNKIQDAEPCLGHESFLLHSVLTGMDEGFAELESIGKYDFLTAATEQLGISLWTTTLSSILEWRDKLVAHLKTFGINSTLPRNFPSYQKVDEYRSPLVSSYPTLIDAFSGTWVKDIDEEALQKLLIEKFLFGAKDYVKWIVQLLVVRTLIKEFIKESTEAHDENGGQEQSSECYQLKLASSNPKKSKSPSLLNATFLVAAATTIDLAAWAEEDNKHAKKEYIVPERFTVRTLRCLLEQAAIVQPEAGGSLRAQRSPAESRAPPSVSRKRQQSPELDADASLSRASKISKGKAPIRNSISDFFQRQHPIPQLSEGSPIASLSVQDKAKTKAPEDPRQAETSSTQATLNMNLTKSHVSHPSSQLIAGMSKLQEDVPTIGDSGKWPRDVSPIAGPSRPPQALRTSYMDLTGDEDELHYFS